MDDNVVTTLAPEKQQPKPTLTPLNTEKETLFDSIAHEGVGAEEESPKSPVKTFLAGLLWFGYTVAIAVALVLVWSAVKSLLSTYPH